MTVATIQALNCRYLMGDDDKSIEVDNWKLTKTVRKGVDSTKLKAAGIYDDYIKESVSYTLKKIVEK